MAKGEEEEEENNNGIHIPCVHAPHSSVMVDVMIAGERERWREIA